MMAIAEAPLLRKFSHETAPPSAPDPREHRQRGRWPHDAASVALKAPLKRQSLNHPLSPLARGGPSFRDRRCADANAGAAHARDEPTVIAAEVPGVLIAVGERRTRQWRRQMEDV